MFVVFIFDNLRQFGFYLSNDLHIWIDLEIRGKPFKNPKIWQEPHSTDFTSLVATATAINLNCNEKIYFQKINCSTSQRVFAINGSIFIHYTNKLDKKAQRILYINRCCNIHEWSSAINNSFQCYLLNLN